MKSIPYKGWAITHHPNHTASAQYVASKAGAELSANNLALLERKIDHEERHAKVPLGRLPVHNPRKI